MTTIHRLLDEAFAGVEATPEVQDLKEEMRANLTARAAELEATGSRSDDAARQAVAELGDIRELVSGLPATPAWRTDRVRPRPRFVVRAVLLSTGAAAALVLLTLDGFGAVSLPLAALGVAVCIAALALGVVTGDGLRQETSANHPMSTPRAAGYGSATAGLLAGLGIGWLVVRGVPSLWLVAAGVLALGALGLFAFLGASQTNRHKTWALRHSEWAADHSAEPIDRFSRDPAAAARFGIYTLIIIVLAAVVFIVLTAAIGWAWSWLALVGGFLVMMLVLARMLFPPER